jgi:hypothetical protein
MGTERTPVFGTRFEIGDGRELAGSGEVGDSLTDAEIPGGESVDIAPGSHGDNIGGPGADAGEGNEVGPETGRVRVVQIEITVDNGLGDRRDRGRSPARHSGLWVIAEAHEGERIRELVGEPERWSREGDSMTFGQASRHRGGAGDTDLLADDHSHHRLEPVPATDHTKTGTIDDKGAEQRILGEVRVGRFHVVIETKEAAHSGDLIDDRLEGRQMSGKAQMVGLAIIGSGEIKLDHTRVATDGHGPTVGRGALIIHHERFDTSSDPRSQVRPNRGQIQRLHEGQPQLESAVGWEAVAAAALGPELARRESEDLLNDSVHLAHTAEATRTGDDSHRKIRLIEQATGEVSASGPGNEVRGGANVLLKEAAQLTGRVTDTIGQRIFVEAIEKPVGDQLDGGRHRLRRMADLH